MIYKVCWHVKIIETHWWLEYQTQRHLGRPLADINLAFFLFVQNAACSKVSLLQWHPLVVPWYFSMDTWDMAAVPGLLSHLPPINRWDKSLQMSAYVTSCRHHLRQDIYYNSAVSYLFWMFLYAGWLLTIGMTSPHRGYDPWGMPICWQGWRMVGYLPVRKAARPFENHPAVGLKKGIRLKMQFPFIIVVM